MPLLFVWILLRKGHCIQVQAIGSTWLTVMLIITAGRRQPRAWRAVARVERNPQGRIVAEEAEA